MDRLYRVLCFCFLQFVRGVLLCRFFRRPAGCNCTIRSAACNADILSDGLRQRLPDGNGQGSEQLFTLLFLRQHRPGPFMALCLVCFLRLQEA